MYLNFMNVDSSSVRTRERGPKKHGRKKISTAVLLGPAFVAAIAYVDPGNVAANLTAGAEYGYLLVWVLVAANLKIGRASCRERV